MPILTCEQVEDGAPKLARMLEATLWEATYDISLTATPRIPRRPRAGWASVCSPPTERP